MREGYFYLKVKRPICGQKGTSVIFDTDTVWVLKQRIFEDEVEGVCERGVQFGKLSFCPLVRRMLHLLL